MEKRDLKTIADLANLDSEKLDQISKLVEIHVLSEIKQKIVRWAQNWAITLTIAFSLLAIFGIDQLVLYRVITEVNSRLSDLDKSLRETEFNISNKMSSKEKEMNTAIQEANEQILKVIKMRDDLDTLGGNLEKIQQEMVPVLAKLREINEKGNLVVVLRKMVDDFYTVRSVELSVKVNFSVDIKKLAAGLGFKTRNFTFGVDLQESVISNRSHSQYYPDTRTITHLKYSKNSPIRAMSYRAKMHIPFESKVYGSLIDNFKFQAIRFKSEPLTTLARAQALSKALNKISSIECLIYVNERRILRKTFKEVNFEASKSEINEKYLAMALEEFREGSNNMRKTYEDTISDR